MQDIEFLPLREPLFIGSYAPVSVKVRKGGRIRFQDVDFLVPEGAPAGTVSVCQEANAAAGVYQILLLAGTRLGRHELHAVLKGTRKSVATMRFELTDRWRRRDCGPSLWLNGSRPLRHRQIGPLPNQPDNLGLNTALGTTAVALLLVDTKTARFRGDAAQEGQRWEDEASKGVVGDDGKTYSAAHYFSEVSYGKFTIDARYCGHLSLDGNWEDYFLPMDSGGWVVSNGQALVTAAEKLVDFSQYATMVFMIEPDLTVQPAKHAWPCTLAGSGPWFEYQTSRGLLNLNLIFVSREQGKRNSYPPLQVAAHRVLVHELGHTLGLPDLGSPKLGDQLNVHYWDPMGNARFLTHFTLANRLRLGWVSASDILMLDRRSGNPHPITATLHPLEVGSPPAGTYAGVEIRNCEGYDYYLEYRRRQDSQIGDQFNWERYKTASHGRPAAVVCTDVVVSEIAPPPAVRPNILLCSGDYRVPPRPAVLEPGEEYKEIAGSGDLKKTSLLDIRVLSMNGSAQVEISNDALNQPDPAIQPWGAPPWQSPDITVSNARSAADPNYVNLPWPGQQNTITARVTNRGTVDAPAVVVDFCAQDYGVGGPEVHLGTDTHDVAGGTTVEFCCPWIVPALAAGAHYCVIARIRPYKTADGISEITELNNVARSTYAQFISASASAYTREAGSFTVSNPYDVPVLLRLVANQDNPLYRTYLEHQWVKLGAREARKIKTMFEFMPELDTGGKRLQSRELREDRERPDHVSIVGMIDDPAAPGCLVLLGGADARVLAGRATRITRFRVIKQRVHGIVTTVSDRWPVTKGKVLVVARRKHDSEEERPAYLIATLDRTGKFVAEPPEDWRELQAYYLYEPGFADCTSEVLKR